MRAITYQMLVQWGACAPERDLFRDIFGELAEVTEENLVKAMAAGLNISWLAERVLTLSSWAEFYREKQSIANECIATQYQAWNEFAKDRDIEFSIEIVQLFLCRGQQVRRLLKVRRPIPENERRRLYEVFDAPDFAGCAFAWELADEKYGRAVAQAFMEAYQKTPSHSSIVAWLKMQLLREWGW